MGKGRAPCCDKNQVKRGPWSPAEDLRLITFIQNHGHDNWRALPKQAGLSRCGKSCRLRWINYLRPDVKRGNFTPDEEKTIVKLHETWGNKWSKIASRLPGRTDNEIKNVWNTHLKKRLQANKVSDSSGDESKESPTTSSSSSSSLLSSNLIQKLDAEPPVGRQPNKDSSMAKQAHGELMNNRLFCPQPANDPKDQTSSSDLSFESTNVSNSASSQADVFWPENPMGSQFDMGEFNSTVEKEEEEVEKKKKQRQQKKLESESQANVGIEIPFECDVDFWNMLDLDDIELFQSKEADQGCQGSNFAAENGGELENEKWFKYLESELGLNQPPGAGEENMSTDGTAENSAERGLVNWSETDPAVDTCLAYFYDGFHRQP